MPTIEESAAKPVVKTPGQLAVENSLNQINMPLVAPMSPDDLVEIARKGKMDIAIISVTRDFRLTIDETDGALAPYRGKTIQFRSGNCEIPRALVDHWYVKGQPGLTVFKSSVSKQEAQQPKAP